MNIASDVIDACGGTQAVATHFSRPYVTVAAWRQRNSIPAAYWSALAQLSDGKISTDQLAALFARRVPPLALADTERRAAGKEAA